MFNSLNINNQAVISLVGAIIGGAIASIPIFIREYRIHKRWLIEKRMDYLRGEITEIELAKKKVLIDLRNLFSGKKFLENSNFVFSAPIEITRIFKKVFKEYSLEPESKIWIKNLTEVQKREIITDVVAALEARKIELKNDIKKMIT